MMIPAESPPPIAGNPTVKIAGFLAFGFPIPVAGVGTGVNRMDGMRKAVVEE